MRRTRSFKATASLALTLLLAASITAQQPRRATASREKDSRRVTNQSRPVGLNGQKRAYSPSIKGHSSSFLIEGRITSLKDNVITIKTARGARYDFEVDDQTIVFGSGELVSIATMADITLKASDLRASDLVEIVTERVGRQEVARIITRIASSGAQVAKR